MKTFKQVVVLLLAMVVAAPALAHHDMQMGAEPALGASAAFAPDGRLWVVTAHDGHVWLRHSDDFGKTLSRPVAVNAEAEAISAEGENRPKIALGPQGEIYVSWTHPLPKPWTGFIRFARSLDGGKHFSAPITVHHDRERITHRFGALVVDAAGNVFVAWIDKRDLAAAKAAGKAYAGAAVYYAWSTDRGKHFEPERKLADHSCECCRIAVAPTPDGGIGVFWRSVFGDNIRDHSHAVVHYGQPAPTVRRATFTGWQIAGCPHQGPGLAVTADGHADGVWFSAKDGKPTIWYGTLDPGHEPKHLQKMAGSGAAHADVAVAGKIVWVVWNQFAPEGTDLVGRVSHDGGASFGKPQILATAHGAAGSPQLLRFRDRTYVAWNTGEGFKLVAIGSRR